ncbi:hypothetical protein NHX12_015351, partial [Muraenolepis orangiensis]
ARSSFRSSALSSGPLLRPAPQARSSCPLLRPAPQACSSSRSSVCDLEQGAGQFSEPWAQVDLRERVCWVRPGSSLSVAP